MKQTEPLLNSVEVETEDLWRKAKEFAEKGKREMKKKEGCQKLLELMARFPELSPESLVLLLVQRPDALELGTREDFSELNNPVREDAFPILLYENEEVCEWFEVSDTVDAPGEIIRRENGFYTGILPGNRLRRNSAFFAFQCTRMYRKLRFGANPDEAAEKELATRLVFESPFAVEAKSARCWEYFCSLRQPFLWNERKRTFFVRRGITGADLVTELVRVRAKLIAADQGMKDAEGISEGVVFVIREMLGFPTGKISRTGVSMRQIRDIRDVILRITAIVEED